MVENPYLPAAVRRVHLVEVGISNFVYGFLAGWLVSLGRQRGAEERAAQTAS